MVSRLTVIFFIVLCLLAGFVLTIFPWISVGKVGDWGNNQLLIMFSQLINMPSLQSFVASGWVRGAVTGLGILNLCLAFWEIANFKSNVDALEEKAGIPSK
ncbi:MAG: hypothetical protein K1X72_00995 [Pyrinomonadaceae bacterium]|nr:hypothetical protein [Pyrinomonadaceae bacterium]